MAKHFRAFISRFFKKVNSIILLQIVAWGARKMLKWVKDTYNNPEIFITENGIADNGMSLEDNERIDFYEVSSFYLSLSMPFIYWKS